MARSPFSPDSLDRRQLLRTSAAAAGLSMMPGRLGAQTAPWSQRPAGTPSQVTFVVWQYGKIYEQIAKQFEQDWSVKINQIIEPNVEPQVAKLTAKNADIAVSGSGDVEIGGGTIATGDYSVTGSGNIDADALVAQNLDISITGSGDVDAHATGKADVTILGSGDVTVKGGATCSTSQVGSGSTTCK